MVKYGRIWCVALVHRMLRFRTPTRVTFSERVNDIYAYATCCHILVQLAGNRLSRNGYVLVSNMV